MFAEIYICEILLFIDSKDICECWFWILIFQIQRCYSVVFVPQVYYTLVPQPWPTVLRTHGIGLTIAFSHGISPIKESIVKCLCIVLQHCKQSLRLCERGCESVKRKCSGFAASCIPSSFWTLIKILVISVWTQPISCVNHVISVPLCNVLNVFFILFNYLTV